MKGYPAYFRNFIYFVLVTLSVSGVLLIPSALEMRLEWSAPWSLSGEPRIAFHAAHATAAFLALFIIGALWVIHIRAGLARRKNHYSGIAMVVLMALLLLSGIGLYYAGDELLGRLSVVLHLATGLLLPLSLGVHIVMARRLNVAATPNRERRGRVEELAWGREG